MQQHAANLMPAFLVIVFIRVVIEVEHFSAGRAALHAVILRIALVVKLIHRFAATLRARHVIPFLRSIAPHNPAFQRTPCRRR